MGVFVADCKEWNKRAAGKKILPHMKVFFATAHREWRLSLQNKTDAPYGTAHNATTNPDGSYLLQDTVDVIENLATNTASDSAAMAQLTGKIAILATDIRTVNKNLVINLKKNMQAAASVEGVEEPLADREPEPEN